MKSKTIEHFKLEVLPWFMREKHWEFRFNIQVNGKEYHKTRIVSLEEINMMESIYDWIFEEARREFLEAIKKC